MGLSENFHDALIIALLFVIVVIFSAICPKQGGNMSENNEPKETMTASEIEEYVKSKYGAVEEVEPDLYIPEVGVIIHGVFMGTRIDDIGGEGQHDERTSLLLDSELGKLRIPAGVNLVRKIENLKEGDSVVIIRMKDGISNDNRTFKNWKVFKVKG